MATQVVDKGVCRSCEAVVGGVCAGLAERFELDPIVVRILAILIALCTMGLGLVAYLVLWVRLPRGTQPDAPYEITPESAESTAFGCVDCSTGRVAARPRAKSDSGISLIARLAIAVGLMLLFLIVAFNLSPLLPGTEWWQFWPLALLISGLCLIVIPVPSRLGAIWHALGIVVTSVAATLMPISLNILAWETLPFALSRGWLLVAAAAVIFGIGARRRSDTLMVTGAFFVSAFCVFALTMCSIPGDAQSLLLFMTDGRVMQIGS